MKAMPGYYALIFEAQSIQTKPSSSFTVLNRIISIKFIKQPSLSYIVSQDLALLDSQPIVNLTFRENLIDLRPKKVEIRIYKDVDEDVIKSYQ